MTIMTIVFKKRRWIAVKLRGKREKSPGPFVNYANALRAPFRSDNRGRLDESRHLLEESMRSLVVKQNDREDLITVLREYINEYYDSRRFGDEELNDNHNDNQWYSQMKKGEIENMELAVRQRR